MTATILALPSSIKAGIFPGNALASAGDSSGDLSYNPLARTPAPNALTVSCWFKISVPSGTNITQNMTILVNRRTGDESSPFAYLVQFNATTGNVEFSARGTSTFTGTLVQRPYLDRWYHVAVARSGSNFTGYLDGRQVFSVAQDVGSSANTDGISIGGWNGSRFLYGEVQEAAIYQAALSQELIGSLMFVDQQPATLPALRGYYKLAYSTTASDNLKNFATTPAAGTDPLTQSGTITFEEANTGGEQSLFDSKKNGGQNALTPLSGAYSWQQTTISRPTAGVPFEFRIGYSSGSAFNSQTLGSFDPFASSVLGGGWRNTFDVRVVPSQYFSPTGGLDSVGLMLWDGSLEVWDFDAVNNLYVPRHGEYRGEFRIPSQSVCEWVTPDRLIYRFYHPFSNSGLGTSILRGRLKEIQDMNGNKLSVTWDTTLGRINKVTDTAGTDWTFAYNAQGLLTSVAGLGWSVNFTYDPSNRLATKTITSPAAYASTPALNTQWQFFYNATSGLLERIVDPRGLNSDQIAYDKYGRKTSQWDALNRSTAFDYNIPANRQVTTTDANGKKWIETVDRKGRTTQKKDPLGNTNAFEYDAFGNVAKSTDARGAITLFSYDSRANMLSKTDALGKVWQWQYNHVLANGTAWNKPTQDSRPATAEAPTGWSNRYAYDATSGSLISHADDLGTLVTYQYDLRGLVISAKDANNHTASSSYDATTGFLLSSTAATGTPQASSTTYTRSELGWPLTQTNALGEVTTFGYNLNGQAVRVQDALNRIITKTFDAGGNLVSETDAKSQPTQYVYDAANQLTQRTDRAGKVWGQDWSPLGKLNSTTDPDSKTTSFTYDDAGRLQKETDPLGNFVTHEYDANGNETALVDKTSQRWIKTYDALNRVTDNTDPLGNSTHVTFDDAGRLKTTATPRGFTQSNDYDGRGRLVKWTDATGFVWLYNYDGVGNILDIEDALHGHYLMTYGPRNERLTEKNQDSKTWSYTYDALLRLQSQTDPNGVTRTLSYDHGGRVSGVSFTTGRSHSFAYDDNSNPLSITRTVGGVGTTTTVTYDALDRVSTSTDAFGQVVGYTYDNPGRVKTLTYPGGKVLTRGYDPLGRLTSLTDWSGRITTFGYDNASRLTSRTYPNGLAQTLSYDTPGRVATSQLAQGGSSLIALKYAYDANSNPTATTSKGILPPTPPTPYDQTSRFTPAGRLIDKVDAADPTHSGDFTYQFDPSGNMTQATSPARSYGFSYDEDNRVLTVNSTASGQSTSIQNRYDALGRRISRTLDSTETRYVLDLTGGMERILCDTDASGTITARYIHGPDLCYKEDASTNTITCYHADAQGNIVRTTDGAGANVNQYAYFAYGRLAGSSGTAANPYRFVGSQGVMEELPNLYFMRARYYSAEAGVFLSTDPVKKIGPGWRPDAYGYTGGNPMCFIDATGKRMSMAQIAKIQQAQQQAYSYQMDAIYWNTTANILQGFADALDTTQSLFEGNFVGVASGFAKQTAGLAEAFDYQNAGAVIRIGAATASAFDTIGDIYKVANNIGQVTRRIGEITEKSNPVSFVNKLAGRDTIYGSAIVAPLKAAASSIASSTGGVIYSQSSSGGSSISNQTVSNASSVLSLNSYQSTSRAAPTITSVVSTKTANSTPATISGGGSSGSSFTSTISKTIQNITNAVSSAVKSVLGFFGW